MESTVTKRNIGIDTGDSSYGIAVYDFEKKHITYGSVGILNNSIGGKNDGATKASKRTDIRIQRRHRRTRRSAKISLLSFLSKTGFIEIPQSELSDWRKSKIPSPTYTKIAHKHNQFEIRSRAAFEQVSKEELAIALVHIFLHPGSSISRGNRNVTDEQKKKDGVIKLQNEEVARRVRETNSRTYGEWAFNVMSDPSLSYEERKIRGLAPNRDELIIPEFNSIIKSNGIEPDSELGIKLRSLVFPESHHTNNGLFTGYCKFEKNKKRCRIGHPAFEKFRALSFIGNIRIEKEDGSRITLNEKQREVAYGCFLKKSPIFKFSVIRNAIAKLVGDKKIELNYKNDVVLNSSKTTYAFNSVFKGHEYNQAEVFNVLSSYDNEQMMREWLKKNYSWMTDEQAAELTSLKIASVRCSYSHKALSKINRYLEKGFDESLSTILANMPYAIPGFKENEDEALSRIVAARDQYEYDKENIVWDGKDRTPLVSLASRIHDILESMFGITDDDWNKLYFSNLTNYRNSGGKPKCKIPKMTERDIRNPMVLKVCNAIIKDLNGLIESDEINPLETSVTIEIPREINSIADKEAIHRLNKFNRKVREEAIKKIPKGVEPSEKLIKSIILAEEQGWTCLYTGKKITVEGIVRGDVFNVEHTLPLSMSGDSSMENLTLCDAHFNQQVKGTNIPQQLANWEEIEKNLKCYQDKAESHEKDAQKAKNSKRTTTDRSRSYQKQVEYIFHKTIADYYKGKIKRFNTKPDDLDSSDGRLSVFKSRQFHNNSIVAKKVRACLQTVFPTVRVISGGIVSFLRKTWMDNEEKDRTDHRHHLKDACVIACSTNRMINNACKSYENHGNGAPSVPFETFRENVDELCAKTPIKSERRRSKFRKSYVNRKVKGEFIRSGGDSFRGPLHCETFIGCRKDEHGNESYFVRKPMYGNLDVVEGNAAKIRDAKTRELVLSQIEEFKKIPTKSKKPVVPKGFFKNDNGKAIIHPVCEVKTIAIIIGKQMDIHEGDECRNRFRRVENAKGSNYSVYVKKGNGGKYEVEFRKSLEDIIARKEGTYVDPMKNGAFLRIRPNDRFYLHESGNPDELDGASIELLNERCYVVVKFDSVSKRIVLRHQYEARSTTAYIADAKRLGLRNTSGASKFIPSEHPHYLNLSMDYFLEIAL